MANTAEIPRSSCEACGFPQPALGYQAVYVVKGYRILRCPRCRLMRTEIPPGFDPSAIYTEEYFQGGMPDGYFDFLGSETVLKKEYAARIKLVRTYCSEGRLLEIGCATGGFIAEAREYFSVQGIDISPFAIQMARRKGLEVDCGPLETCAIIRPPYGIVVMWDTLEHLASPARMLQYTHSILKEGGFVVLTTGDQKSPWARMAGRRWRLMTPPQHLWFFDRDNISLLLSQSGFRVLSIQHLWRRVPLSLIWYQLFRGRAKPLPTGLARTPVPVNLYDTMTVICQKAR